MTDSMFEVHEVEQGAPGAWWLFALTASSWLCIFLLVFELTA